MKKLFRAIRYSSVGIFLAGIITTIVGCSTEDQLRALLLFLLMLFSGGGGSSGEINFSSPANVSGFAGLADVGITFSVQPSIFPSIQSQPVPLQSFTFVWDFGDGSIGTGNPVTHIYAMAGTYRVCVTITNTSSGNRRIVCVQIQVGASPLNFVTGTLIDRLTIPEATPIRTLPCEVGFPNLDTVIPNLYGGLTRREVTMTATPFTTGTSDVTFKVPGDGTISISVSGAPGTGCDWLVNVSVLQWVEDPITNTTDLSGIAGVAIPVLSASGVTGCTIREGAAPFLSSVAVDPVPPGVLFPNPGWSAAGTHIRLTGCNFSPGAKLVIGSPIVVP